MYRSHTVIPTQGPVAKVEERFFATLRMTIRGNSLPIFSCHPERSEGSQSLATRPQVGIHYVFECVDSRFRGNDSLCGSISHLQVDIYCHCEEQSDAAI